MNFIGPFSDCPLHQIPQWHPGMRIHLRKIATTKGLPCPLADVMLDLRVDSDDEAPTVERMLRGAAAFLERRTGIAFLAGRYEAHFNDVWAMPWEFERFPYRSLVSFEKFDTTVSPPSWVDIGTDRLHVEPRQASFVVHPIHPFADTAYGTVPNGIRLRFDAGFDPVFGSDQSDTGEGSSEGDDADVETAIEPDALTLLVAMTAHFYQNRELFAADKAAEVEASAGALLTSRRKFW